MIKRILGILFLFSGLFLLSFVKYQDTVIEQTNETQMEEYFEEKASPTPMVLSTEKEDYLGILEIPKINLKRGFYSFSSKKNDVDSNIEVISSDCYPGNACSFVLASHSGTSSIAFFKHLNELQLKDTATIYYNNTSYDYVLKNIQHVNKNGTISLLQPKESELVLTTCNKNNNSLQDIYIFELKKEA